MALFMHTPATLRDLKATLGDFQSRIEAVARQLDGMKPDEPLGIDYQVRVEKALEGLNAFCADAEMRVQRRTYALRRDRAAERPGPRRKVK
jgi:hypothetical protein